MSHIVSVCDAVDFIEDNLKEEITVADIADAASYSLYHFCRTFNRVIHHTPYDYLMRRRLSESARELVETDKKIVEVAFAYRFRSAETYSRAFKRLFGIQPYKWRKQGRLDERLLMPRLTPAYIQHISKGDYLKPVLEERSAFRLVGVMTLVREDREVISQAWEILAQELDGLEGARGSKNCYGVTWYPDRWQTRGFLYLAAVEAGSLDSQSSALAEKTIPPSRYARFVHKGPRRDLRLTLDYVYQTWLPKSGERLAHPLEIECFERGLMDMDSEESEWHICIPLK